ncbi:MAG: O-antigen ligase domain-containing protein, partial [Caldilineae bacterium]
LATLQAENLAEAAVEVIKWAEVLLVVWLVSQTLDSRQARWLAAGLLVGGSLQALLGIYQFLFRVGPEAFLLMGRFMRAAGTFHQPNPYAGYLGLTLPVAVSLALFAWQRAAALAAGLRERTEALAWAVFTTAAAGLMGLGLLASWSRGGWLGAVAGVGLVVVLRSRRALVLSLFGLLILAVLAVGGAVNPSLVPAAVTERLADVPAYLGVGVMEVVRQPVTDENFSVIERLAHWIAAVRMWEAHPWLGVGPGNYPVVYPGVRLPLWEDPLGHAHNIYLNVLAESGLTGLAAYLIMWVTVAGRLVRRLGREEDPWQRALIVGVLGVLAHLTVHNLFDNLFVQGMHLHVALWLAGTLKGED